MRQSGQIRLGVPTTIKRRRFGMRRRGKGVVDKSRSPARLLSGPASRPSPAPQPQSRLLRVLPFEGRDPSLQAAFSKSSRSSVTHPPGVPGDREPRGNSKRSLPPSGHDGAARNHARGCVAHRAISSLRASATTIIRRIRPAAPSVRLRNHWARSLSGCQSSQRQLIWII